MHNIDKHNYEVYCRIVTDNFIAMQTVSYSDNKEKIVVVEWEEGLDWRQHVTFETCPGGNLLDELKIRNAEIALEYLRTNFLTFEQWFDKYRK